MVLETGRKAEHILCTTLKTPETYNLAHRIECIPRPSNLACDGGLSTLPILLTC